MDFTVKKYRELLEALIQANYSFQTFEEFLESPLTRTVILRHDVDLKPENSLRFARIQHEKGIKGVYYFRAVPESWDESIIKAISAMGHEIGYHYECLTTTKGDLKKGIADFSKNLDALKQLAPVRTICMHGSPLSRYDSKDLWKSFNYRDYGIVGEPYFDTDFSSVFYLTDTGRKWDGEKVSIRDRVNSGFKLSFHHTDDIISSIHNKALPDQVMFTFHPQRWNDKTFPWLNEYFTQNLKNLVKKALILIR